MEIVEEPLATEQIVSKGTKQVVAELVQRQDIDFMNMVVLDAHLLKTYRACEQKFNYFEEHHVIGKGVKAAPGFGISMHAGIEHYRKAKMEGKNFDQALIIGAGHLLKAYKDNMPKEAQSEVLQDDKRSLDNALRIYEGYCKHYEPMGYKFHYVEVPFAMYLGKIRSWKYIDLGNGVVSMDVTQVVERELVYVGIIDAVLEMHNALYVNDLKTTAWSISESWLEGFRMDQGLCGYTVAAKEILGVDTQHALVHGIWVQKEAKTTRGKPLDEYFQSKEIHWDQGLIDEWHRNTIMTAERIERSRLMQEWQMDWGQNCGAFGGCEYRPLCSAPPKFRRHMIEVEYQRAIWAPLEDERLQKIEGL